MSNYIVEFVIRFMNFKNRIVKDLFKIVLVGIFFLLKMSICSAQDIQYDYEDDYEDDNYNNQYYERYSEEEYKRRNQKFYKRTYKEEDLYNGGYRSKTYSDNQNMNSFGGWGLFSNGKSKKTNVSPEDISDKPFNKYEGIENGVGMQKDRNNSESFSQPNQNFEPGKGNENPNTHDPKTAPPPPDEPDVPIDSVEGKIGLILSILLVVFIKKRL